MFAFEFSPLKHLVKPFSWLAHDAMKCAASGCPAAGLRKCGRCGQVNYCYWNLVDLGISDGRSGKHDETCGRT